MTLLQSAPFKRVLLLRNSHKSIVSFSTRMWPFISLIFFLNILLKVHYATFYLLWKMYVMSEYITNPSFLFEMENTSARCLHFYFWKLEEYYSLLYFCSLFSKLSVRVLWVYIVCVIRVSVVTERWSCRLSCVSLWSPQFPNVYLGIKQQAKGLIV